MKQVNGYNAGPLIDARKTLKLGRCSENKRESIKETVIVLGSTDPANYGGSNARGSKETVDIEIAMCRSDGIRIAVNIAAAFARQDPLRILSCH